MSDDNPYQSSLIAEVPAHAEPRRRSPLPVILGWITVFAMNLAVPLLFGWRMTEQDGKVGLLGAVLVLWIASLVPLLMYRDLAAPVIVGSILVALSQFFPVLQILAGLLAFALASGLGLGVDVEHGPGVSTALGGFVVTLVTGFVLLAASAGCGLLIRVITPGSWWKKREPLGEAVPTA